VRECPPAESVVTTLALFGDHPSKIAVAAFVVETTHGSKQIDDRRPDCRCKDGEDEPRIDGAEETLDN